MDLVEIFLNPALYPEPTSRVELIQTHISYVFLTDRHAYKVKKPVNFGFLDFSTLRKRHYFLNQELLLNRRLAPEIYLAVLPLVRQGRHYRLGGAGRPLEYALQMVRLPQERMMDEVAARRELQPEVIQRLVQILVPFYARAATGPRINKFGEPAVIRFNQEENFTQIRPFVGQLLPEKLFQDMVNYSRNFLDHQRDLFKRRLREGRIRDCHGDLHMRNICLADGIYIFDCLEFNPRFRYGDVIADLAFLAMDLDFNGYQELSDRLVREYANLAPDPDSLLLLDFYKCYRAVVRGKVNALATTEAELPWRQRQEASRLAAAYFQLAWCYTQGVRTCPASF